MSPQAACLTAKYIRLQHAHPCLCLLKGCLQWRCHNIQLSGVVAFSSELTATYTGYTHAHGANGVGTNPPPPSPPPFPIVGINSICDWHHVDIQSSMPEARECRDTPPRCRLTVGNVTRAKPHLGVLYLLQLILQAGATAGLAIPSHRSVPTANLGIIDALLHQRSHLLLSGACTLRHADDARNRT